ncbi:hypothetical protein BGX26_002883 [Mortierella sp. AD094]|nr:hypothetical protein BGX26_002883 [Mortierella sp. AD094]
MKKSFGNNKSKDKKKSPKEEATPQTWEEYMEGERYGTGDKARRFYEKAGDMYNKACKLNPEDSDCLYNLRLTSKLDIVLSGRVLYILVDFTHSPCQKLSLLNASIERFRSALTYDPDNADTLFNLGQALTTHAEVIQDHEEGDEEDEEADHKHGDHDDFHGSPEERAATELQEAITLFESCYSIQQRDLYAAVQEANPKNNADKEEKPQGLAEQEQQELSNSAGVLIDTLISSSQALTSLAFLVDTVDHSKSYYKQALERLDIALGVANDKYLWPASEELSSSSGKGKDREAVAERIVEGEYEEILPATKPVSVFREAEAQSENVSRKEKICDIHLQYSTVLSSQTDRNYQDTGKISEELYEKSLQHLDVVLSHQPRHVEALCDKGDLLGAWAQGLAAFDQGAQVLSDSDIERWDSSSNITLGTSDVVAAEPTSGSVDGKKTSHSARTWQLFASATRAFLSALEVEPQNTSILEKLGDIHWSRSLLSSAVAVKNRAMLLNNASVYYRFAWESCRDGSAENVDEDQRQEILLSWAQVLRAMPGKEEEVLRVLKQWKRCGGTKEMLVDMLEGNSGDILQEEFVEFALKQVRKGL